MGAGNLISEISLVMVSTISLSFDVSLLLHIEELSLFSRNPPFASIAAWSAFYFENGDMCRIGHISS